MQRTVHNYLKALEAGDAERAAALFITDGWVESPFLGRLPVRQFVKKVAEEGTNLFTVQATFPAVEEDEDDIV